VTKSEGTERLRQIGSSQGYGHDGIAEAGRVGLEQRVVNQGDRGRILRPGPCRQQDSGGASANESSRSKQTVGNEQADRAGSLDKCQGLNRTAQGHQGATTVGPAAGEHDPDMTSPGIAQPVHGLNLANRVEHGACGLGAIVERVSPPGVAAGAVSWPVDDDQAPLRCKLVLDPSPGPFVHEQAVPQHGGRPSSADSNRQRTHLRVYGAPITHVRHVPASVRLG